MITTRMINTLLTAKGDNLRSLKVITSSSVDPDFPSKGPIITSVSYPLVSYPGKYKNRQIDGELIKLNDIKLYIDPTDLIIIPTVKDQVTHIDGRVWNIKEVREYYEGGVVIIYILQLRT